MVPNSTFPLHLYITIIRGAICIDKNVIRKQTNWYLRVHIYLLISNVCTTDRVIVCFYATQVD